MDDKVAQDAPTETSQDTSQVTSRATSKFDWVTERSKCALPNIFKTLRLEIEADVKARNALRPNNSPYEFSVQDDGYDFAVVLEAKDGRRSVTFSLAEHVILVRDDKGNKMHEVTLTFNERGECKVHVNEEEREMWQVRRMALEDLLFRGY